jgi:hypothetical protein
MTRFGYVMTTYFAMLVFADSNASRPGIPI